MEKKTINPKIRTAFIAIFALAIVLSTTSLIMQLPFQSANAKNYFEDPYTGDIWSCGEKYDTMLFDVYTATCVD
jgi:hypothetical protein